MANRASADLVGKAIEQIDRERMVKMTMDLTNIPSPTGYEGDMARAVNELLRGAGFDSVLQPIGDERYNAVGRLQGKGGGKSLMFNGHLDTSFGPEQAHRGIGYKCEGTLVDNEWIYGMGSFNMKSAMATYITASEAIRKAGIKLGGDVVIAGVAGEIEKSPVNDYEGRQYQGYGVGTKYAITHGAVADYCILGEPTNMMLISRHCGTTWIKITVPGHLIHTAWSEVERNAINKSRVILDAIHEWIPDYCRRHAVADFQPRVNVSAIEGGWPWRGARTPDNCVIYLDVRTVPDVLPVQAFNEVRDMVNAAVKKHPQLDGTKCEIFLSAPGTSIPEESDLIRQITAAHANQLGKPPERGIETWYSDAAHMNRYGIPTVNYGSAGRIRTGGGGFSTHQGEHVHIGDMVDIVRVYIEVMMNICGVVE
ncbi:MAG: M20/M25/M40 family metallo-hydrolase [Rhodocyclaceae bacterium]|jgi:acetylornithine deacetylase|nr:M20/M25/M40 family metallo-hydrolase [Rhodocyclaceae bacterium]MCC8999050.1 M20/M25/M40 family metallo-hydrolase [Candidatus Contendobacter sp.]MBK6678368.1 M20/M25/M40 family metallo-hydrolase [Rhodocyclaceae bacterium]MBK7813669.1 M20/M25/M40 family metallo-hydrolase [Rhodocyclaceae bacterium]MBK9311028.1 M20/M25/M40 family metallo-hydrolase [Rhodocyclaceae bacterium]